jgi:hypothetical protein
LTLFQWLFHQIRDNSPLLHEKTLQKSFGGRHQPTKAVEWFLLPTSSFLNQVEAPTTLVGAVPMALSSNHGQLSSAT